MKSLLALSFLVSSVAFAQETDLSLPGEKWAAKFTGFVCAASTPAQAAPVAFAKYQVAFERLTTDSTLDNGLIKATFVENGKSCRYSAIILADNAAATSRLIQSKAFSPSEDSECTEGKAALDAHFENNTYLYYGHPHNIAFMAFTEGAEEVCEGSSQVGVNFVVAGKVTK
jgi:hypothetical protein